MNHFSKLTCMISLTVISHGAAAYNYSSAGCGNINYGGGHMTFNYANNLSTAEKSSISTAFSRLTVFSDSSITTVDNNDSNFGRSNSQNEIYHDTSHGTAQCWSNYNTSTCNVNEADIRFGDEPWVTDTSSQHWPYLPFTDDARSIMGTAVHEGGHCIGMAHENSLYNMMGSDWSHVTRQGVSTYYGPGEDLSDGLIDLHGKRSTTDAYRDVGATVMRYDSVDGQYSEHRFGVLRDTGGVALPVVGSFEGQDTFEVVAGDTVRMELTFENNGEKNQELPDVGFYLSNNSIISTADTLLRVDNAYSLGRGTPYEVNNETVTIPIDTPPGNYFLGAFVDHLNLISETTNANNVAYYPVTILAPPSDLTVPFAGVDDTTVAPGATIRSLAVVRNDGLGPSVATSLRYYRSTNSVITTGDTLIALDSIAALDAGAVQAANADTAAPGTPGTWWYGACVNPVPRESNTANQCSTGTQVTVAYPPPSVATNPATAIDMVSAQLNATYDPNGAPTTVYFDWGTTTAYGNTVQYSGPIAAGTVGVTVTGLVCNQTYHFRARAVSAGGVTVGGNQQFVTLVCAGCE